MNKILEINKCLHHLIHYSNYPQQPSCFMSIKFYYNDIINFDNYNMFEPQNLQFQDLNNSNIIESDDDVTLQNDDSQKFNEENFRSPNINQQSQVNLIQQFKLRQSINKEIHIKQVPLDIFIRQLTPKRSIPLLFDDESNINIDIKQKQTQNYRPLRERIQEKLSQKQIDKKEQQVINNRFSNTTQNSANRYHSKSPQSQFTKEFKQKFNSINQNQNFQFKIDQFNSNQRQSSNLKNSSTPQLIEQHDSKVKLKFDIQNFQVNNIRSINQKQEKENIKIILTPQKTKNRINYQYFELETKTKKQIFNNKSKSPNKFSKNSLKTPEKEHCKYVVVNFYQKKY